MGLVYFGYRDYDIELGSWSTPDPLGFADGPNLYAYVHHNPVMLFDPDGTTSFGESSNSSSNSTQSSTSSWWDYTRSKASYAYDRTAHYADEYRVGTRLAGAGRFLFGATEVVGGCFFGVYTSAFGGWALGGGAAIHGADNICTGFDQFWTGEEKDTLTSRGLQYCGMSRNTANIVSDGIGMAGIGYTYSSINAVRNGILTTNRMTLNNILKVSSDNQTISGGQFSINQLKSIIKSASTSYKSSTRIGHSLSKHAGEKPGIWGKISGPMKEWHQQGMRHFREIMRGPGKFENVKNKHGIWFREKKLPDGRGVRLQMDYEFKGFID